MTNQAAQLARIFCLAFPRHTSESGVADGENVLVRFRVDAFFWPAGGLEAADTWNPTAVVTMKKQGPMIAVCPLLSSLSVAPHQFHAFITVTVTSVPDIDKQLQITRTKASCSETDA